MPLLSSKRFLIEKEPLNYWINDGQILIQSDFSQAELSVLSLYEKEKLDYWTDKAQKISKEVLWSSAYNRQADTVCGVPIENIERGTVKYSDVLAAELQRVLLKEEKRFSDFGEEPKGLRSVVTFDIQFTERGKWYNYAAIRCGDNKWYTIGTKRAAGYTWEELLDFIEDVHKYRKFKVMYAQKVRNKTHLRYKR